MVNSRVEIFISNDTGKLRSDINEFLKKIDVRQIVKMEYNSTLSQYRTEYTCIIMFIEFEDIRDIKIDSILGGN